MENTSTFAQTTGTTTDDFLPLLGTDYIEFYVGNAKQAAYYYQHAWGYKLVAYAGPETGVKDRASYVLMQDKIRLVLTTSLLPDSAISEHVKKHGDGVKVLALWVEDAAKALEETLKRGAKQAAPLASIQDAHGEVRTASIHTYGETIHTFVERKNYKGAFLPGFQPVNSSIEVKPVGLRYVDHCVGNVGWGEMNTWVKFYEDVLGFKVIISFDDQDISTEYSALMSKVVSNGNGFIKFPINEPAEGKKRSQVEEYLDFYHGAGVQHIAVATDNIIETVSELRRRGVDFLEVPGTYYDDLYERVGKIDEDMEDIRRLNILVDRDDEGYLLQLFTKPVEDRPTLFYEIIQRRGARAFGKGNFKALFEAIEREQERRGTL
ncbi:MAG: 4-hydroxyphenylpyruvate dioxygenase [Bacteroidia bacterium]|nr:4-hydroxyphenylpyruvate dioxygenase [Bacteroidia bacterium]MCC6768672.1 4-hydroxyphenylpyruvate dioxygenase [Bacteroidia bacterium]